MEGHPPRGGDVQRGVHMALLKRFAVAFGALGLTLGTLPAGLAPALADGTTYTYVEIPLGAGRPSSSAAAINSSGEITGSWSLGRAWTSDNGGPIQELGTLGGCCSWGYGISDAGHVVGNSYNDNRFSPPRAFLYQDGAMVDLGTGYADYRSGSAAYAVNSLGHAVGFRFAAALAPFQATLWQDGALVDLGTLGGDTSTAFGINDSDQIVGSSKIDAHYTHAFIYQDGSMQDLGAPGDATAVSVARAIAANGAIAGSGQPSSSSPSHALLWQDGNVTDLGTLPGRTSSYAYGVNNVGQVVGLSRRTDNHAFVWQNGQMTDLNDVTDLPAGVVLSVAYAINDSGMIVGQTCNFIEECPGGVSPRAFLLIPNAQGGAGSLGHARSRGSAQR